MDVDGAKDSSLRTFQQDAERLLAVADDCMAHLHLITNDPDACRCLNTALAALVSRSALAGVDEVTRHAEHLRHLLSGAFQQRRLAGPVLPCAQACLTLLAWQLELLDPQTRRVDLDDQEQRRLLDDLASALHIAGLRDHRDSSPLAFARAAEDP
ncbi:histidine kinase [Pseudomonas sp. RP23018S]|uniref:histidine kinase n=1 Tax=Pseudomonas sp. RP23018S TaxID=3096037 RepID=UPI002ACAA8BE|nr:histidine kinase [Pseudomonas sp. RP23018S]MDZ5602283.1 histidine kinase [Pseudomonas sp. RP23018S]